MNLLVKVSEGFKPIDERTYFLDPRDQEGALHLTQWVQDRLAGYPKRKAIICEIGIQESKA